jgi:hypothetical protein
MVEVVMVEEEEVVVMVVVVRKGWMEKKMEEVGVVVVRAPTSTQTPLSTPVPVLTSGPGSAPIRSPLPLTLPPLRECGGCG